MPYSGKFTPKNREKYKGDPDSIIFRSLWELHCFKWADSSPDVRSWSSEEVVVPYIWDVDKKPHRYFVDLKVTFSDGKTWLIEVKPHKETQKPVYPGKKTARYLNESMTYVKNQNKWRAAEKYAEERGWEFHIWTEHELHKFKIMPKQQKFKLMGKGPGKLKGPPRGKGLKAAPKPWGFKKR